MIVVPKGPALVFLFDFKEESHCDAGVRLSTKLLIPDLWSRSYYAEAGRPK